MKLNVKAMENLVSFVNNEGESFNLKTDIPLQ